MTLRNQKKNEIKKGRGNIQESKKKKKKRTETNVQLAHGHFCHSPIRIPTTQFSLHFEEKTFWQAQGENTQAPPSFSPIPLPVKHFQKSFPFSFSLIFFPILPKIHSTKHKKMIQFYRKQFFEKMTYFLENIVVEINKIVKTKVKCIHYKYFYFLLLKGQNYTSNSKIYQLWVPEDRG